MLIFTVFFGIAFFLLFFLLLFFRREIKSLTGQLRELKGKDTNMLLHTDSGMVAPTLELTREINALLDDMRRSKIHYAKKRHNLEQMMTNISHDLRTPLTSAMGYLDMVLHSDLPAAEKDRELTIIAQRLHRLEELINSFFEFSQVIAGEQRPEKRELNLVGILEESIAHYYDDYCAQNRTIDLRCEKSRLFLPSNQNMLMRIFDNLIGNSLKHGAGELVVSVEGYGDAGQKHFIAIRFENALLDSHLDLDRIFDEFYTTDISRTKGNTGLGLAIAKQFTEMLGGTISASCEGGRFAVTVVFAATVDAPCRQKDSSVCP